MPENNVSIDKHGTNPFVMEHTRFHMLQCYKMVLLSSQGSTSTGCCNKINYLLSYVSGIRLCSSVPNAHHLGQARWSLCNSSHIVMFSATVKVSKVKAIQHKFQKTLLYSAEMSFTRKAAKGDQINHSYQCIPYTVHIHLVWLIMHSNQWNLCFLDPVHCIEKFTSAYLCVYDL